MIHLKYCCISALLDDQSKEYITELGAETHHPQHVIKAMGITYQHATPQSVGDQWWFWNCENIPDKLPNFLTELEADPLNCIGFGLSEEKAKEIKEGENEPR